MITVDEFKQKMNSYDDYIVSLRDNFNNRNISSDAFKDLNPKNNIIGGFLSNFNNRDLFSKGDFLSNFFTNLETLDDFIYIFSKPLKETTETITETEQETTTDNLTKFIEDTLLKNSMNVDILYNGPMKAKSDKEKAIKTRIENEEAEYEKNIRKLENMDTTQFPYSPYLNGAFENTSSNVQNEFDGDKYLRIFEIIIYWKLFNAIRDTRPDIIANIDSIFEKFENTTLTYADLNDDEKTKLKSTTLIDVLNFAFQQDATIFNKFVIYSPCPSMVFQNNNCYDPLELVINGYRIPLYKYFTHDIFERAEKDELIEAAEDNEKLAVKSYVVQSLMDNNNTIKQITDIFNNYFAPKNQPLYNNRYERKRANITNDILFIAIVVASFFNCPITSTILQSLIRCRFNEKEYRTSAYEIVNNTLSKFISRKEKSTQETPKKEINSDDYILYSSFIKKFTDNDGDYILPSWPFNEFYDNNEFNNIIVSHNRIQKISLGYIVMFSSDFISPVVIENNKSNKFSRIYDLIGQIYRISLPFKIKTNAGTMDYNPDMIIFNCSRLENYNERFNKYGNNDKDNNKILSPIFKLISNFSKDLSKEEKENIINEHIKDIVRIIAYLNKFVTKITFEKTYKKQFDERLTEIINGNYNDIDKAANSIKNIIFKYGFNYLMDIGEYETETIEQQVEYIGAFFTNIIYNYSDTASELEISIANNVHGIFENFDSHILYESYTLYEYFAPLIKRFIDKLKYICILYFNRVKDHELGYCLIPSTRNINIRNEIRKQEAQQQTQYKKRFNDLLKHDKNKGIKEYHKAIQAEQDEKHGEKIIAETMKNMLPNGWLGDIPTNDNKLSENQDNETMDTNDVIFDNPNNPIDANKLEGGGRKKTIKILKILCFIGFILLVVSLVVHLILLNYEYEEENIYNDYDN